MRGFSCFACNGAQPADFAGFVCPDCGNNLDVTYDYGAIIDEIEESGTNAARSMFRFAPFLPVSRPDRPFPLAIGKTPLYAAKRLGASLGMRNLYLKDDTVNPSASSKDRASAIAVRRAMDIGAETISVASTGNAGSSLACVAAATGMPAVVFVPESAPAPKLTQALSFGATVIAVRGSYDDAFDLCLHASREFGWFNRSTGYNPFTREGKKVCAYEIWEALDGRAPDRVVVPTGDGNLLSGMWKGWRDLQAVGLIDRPPRLICAQSESSAAICGTVRELRAGDTDDAIDWSTVLVAEVRASSVADSINVDCPRDGLAAVRAVMESGGAAVAVPDGEILAAVQDMARLSGVFPEPAAAAPLAALRTMRRDGTVAADELVVCLVSGSGLKDVAGARQSAPEPLVVDPTVDAVADALERQRR